MRVLLIIALLVGLIASFTVSSSVAVSGTIGNGNGIKVVTTK